MRGLTDVVGAAARARVADLAPGALAVSGVGDVHVLLAVSAIAVDLRGNRNDLVAVDVGLATRAEADVEPGALRISYVSIRPAPRRDKGTLTRPVWVTRFSSAAAVPLMGDANAVQTSARAKMKNVKGDMVKERKGRDRRASVCRRGRDGESGGGKVFEKDS